MINNMKFTLTVNMNRYMLLPSYEYETFISIYLIRKKPTCTNMATPFQFASGNDRNTKVKSSQEYLNIFEITIVILVSKSYAIVMK